MPQHWSFGESHLYESETTRQITKTLNRMQSSKGLILIELPHTARLPRFCRRGRTRRASSHLGTLCVVLSSARLCLASVDEISTLFRSPLLFTAIVKPVAFSPADALMSLSYTIGRQTYTSSSTLLCLSFSSPQKDLFRPLFRSRFSLFAPRC